MRFLFIHQNFPGQFPHASLALAEDPANEVVCLGDIKTLKGRPPFDKRLKVLGYKFEPKELKDVHPYLREYQSQILRGQEVARVCNGLKSKGFVPDVIMAHPAWGESLFLKDVYPDARLIVYAEFYYGATGADTNFDPEFPPARDGAWRIRIKNSTQVMSLVSADQAISPTQWQKSRYPSELQGKIHTIHEGIDTRVVAPSPGARANLKLINGNEVAADDELVTFVSRNLEPYRGFHVFMRSLPALQAARPKARVLIIGGDEVSYGRRLPAGQTYRQKYCEELGDSVDWSRVHFLGKLPYATYLNALQVSACHVYLTYPFVLSWSLTEAMAAGCRIVASRTPPVQELLTDGLNARLVDFFDSAGVVTQICKTLDEPEASAAMATKARSTIVENYDLKTQCLPVWLKLLKGEDGGP